MTADTTPREHYVISRETIELVLDILSDVTDCTLGDGYKVAERLELEMDNQPEQTQ